MTITITVECADSVTELSGCLSSLREWERARPEIRMAISVDAQSLSRSDVEGVFRSLHPPLPVVGVIPLQ